MKSSGIFITFLLVLYVCNTQGQQIASTSGDHFKAKNIQMSWTIGEPVIETCSGNQICLTQGMHQSNLQVTAIEQITGLNMNILAYPNPASDFVQLKVESIKYEMLNYLLYGADGKLITSGKLIENQATIPMQDFVHATYLLKVVNDKNVYKTFKIVKSR